MRKPGPISLKGLQDGLKSLNEELKKVKGVTAEVRKGFEQEVTFAYADQSINAVKVEMMELNGEFGKLAELDIDQKVKEYEEALKNASPAAREAAASVAETRPRLKNVSLQTTYKSKFRSSKSWPILAAIIQLHRQTVDSCRNFLHWNDSVKDTTIRKK